jgi:hypothetical protein
MSKSLRHHKKSLKQKRKNRSRKIKNHKLKKRNLKGGNGEKVICSMCEKMVDLKDTFVPGKCLTEHGKAAHRICKDCWWAEEKGFALEASSHKCPGCLKGLPLTTFIKEPPIFVDLTED